MPLINCKVELKFRRMKHCVLSMLGNENDNGNVDSNDIIFTVKKNRQLKGNQKSSKLLSKDFERLVYWN